MAPADRLRTIIGPAALDKLMSSELAGTQMWVPVREHRRRTPLGRARDREIKAALDAGETLRSVARTLGVSTYTVVKAAKR